MSQIPRLSLLLAPLALALGACGEDPVGGGNEEEVISRVELTLTPMVGDAVITAVFDDPDGDGGAPPTVDPLVLAPGTTYVTAVRFLNALEVPAEDITLEVADESDVHQVFYTGTAVDGPASDRPGAPLAHAYTDTDVNGAPVGLASTLTTSTGTGELIVTLRHLPPVNGAAAKTADLASVVRTAGFAALPGATDAQVTFGVSILAPTAAPDAGP